MFCLRKKNVQTNRFQFFSQVLSFLPFWKSLQIHFQKNVIYIWIPHIPDGKSWLAHLCQKITSILRVPDQNGVSQAWYIVEIHHSGWEPWILTWSDTQAALPLTSFCSCSCLLSSSCWISASDRDWPDWPPCCWRAQLADEGSWHTDADTDTLFRQVHKVRNMLDDWFNRNQFLPGGRNSSVGSAWAHCPQCRGFDPPLGIFSVEGIFPLELT